MHQPIVIGLAVIILLGISAQWFAWRFKIPSILLLLIFGFMAGPVTGILHPDELFGELLFPFVSLSVAIILFEGGLSLKLDEIRGVQSVVRLLVSLGALVSWGIVSVAAYYILQFDLLLSVLTGAVLVVTGPTVVMPLLRQIRPVARVASVLKWEGILIDPVGATLAVLVFEGIIHGGEGNQLTFVSIMTGIIVTLLVGTVIGGGVGYCLIQIMKRKWISPGLETAIVVMAVVVAFAISNELREEAGLMAVTIMGIIMVNQKKVDVSRIIHFKEELVVLLLSVLFIVLAARVEIDALIQIAWQDFAFLLIIILVARPLSVFASTLFSNVPFKERLFISAMAPRGIVAVSVASLFALELTQAGFDGADQLVNITFVVVVGTVLVYSLVSRPLAKLLGLTEQTPQGTLIVGAHHWGRQLALAIQELGFDVWLVDTNNRQIDLAKKMGLNAVRTSIMTDGIIDEIPIEQIGRIFAMTANSELNTLATLHFTEWVGSKNVFQLAPILQGPHQISENLRGHILFDETLHFNELDRLYYLKAEIITLTGPEIAEIAANLDFDENRLFQPLFGINADDHMIVVVDDETISPDSGLTAAYLVDADVKIELDSLQETLAGNANSENVAESQT
ncbi:MAG: cation:proton antiporter [Anaerolineae bacterium]